MARIAIIGGGISGLATAYAVEQLAASRGVTLETILIEKEDRTGGKIWSIQEEGYLCEWGPNGFLDNKPMTLELCDRLGIRDQLARSDDNARKRFIYSGAELHRLPENGPSFFKSNLMTWPGKFRIAKELFVPKRTEESDETLAEFGRRRLGPEALDKLIAPMVSGIFAGNPETMSLKSCFPRIYQLEQEYGGLLRAMMKLAKQKKAERKAGKQVASAAGPGGTLTSFVKGIQELTDSTTTAIKGEVKRGSAAVAIKKVDGGYEIALESGAKVDADVVVTAVPAYHLAQMIGEMSVVLSDILKAILYAPMNVVCFGYEREKIEHDLNGFGYLIPKKEGCSILGTLWDSSIFPNRAPEGHVLLRSMMGGATNPAAIDLSDNHVQEYVQADLREIMGIDAMPDFVRIFRHRNAIPQYTTGHGQRLLALEEGFHKFPGFFITGNAFFGIGLNDCVQASNRTAEKVVGFLERHEE
ncbi:MAG: protoporphyrinogen oxidase [Desulfuromonas sp.]|nr:MAG: protoporphyrinogen oxidase [Desulfuromonas sp.]